ncbi:VOC family protein [Fictibacillus barbaricus]|uniref:Catechol 2,3-dioxygenase-like lactoylglutathione lyase family enzyme n=1 Tax=Fictibacillus barbaricus TaxID=182136 RepID=A0ABU1U3Z5_9BACL|nr:VOC family protein [Fictibacillus barbaricus]MDR7074106.1 catechol 2,3-dioxygenase-like lactoylglutathione lyase family enzyme [Fictibacillus barbaricus]
MYEGIHHVSVLVTNLKESLYFYEGILGFKQNKKRPQFDFPGVWYDIGNTQLHLIQYPEGKARRNTTQIDSRDGHFAVRVKDMGKLLQILDHHKIPYLNKEINKTEWHQVYVSDPDGNLIEFNA